MSASKKTELNLRQLEDKIAELSKNKHMLIDEITAIELSCKDTQGLIERMQKSDAKPKQDETQALNIKAEEYKVILANKQVELKKIDATLAETKTIVQQPDNLEKFEEQTRQYAFELDTKRKELGDISDHINQIGNEKKRAATEFAKFKSELSKEVNDLKGKVHSYNDIAKKIETLNVEIDNVKQQHFSISSKGNEVEQEYQQAKESTDTHKAEIELKTNESNELKKAIKENDEGIKKCKKSKAELDKSFLGKLKKSEDLQSTYADAVKRLHEVDKGTTERNAGAETLHKNYEAKHAALLAEFEEKRNSLLAQQNNLRVDLNKSADAYQAVLSDSATLMDDQSRMMQKQSDDASAELDTLKKAFAENEETRQERLDKGEDATSIMSERDEEQAALNKLIQDELTRLRTQEEKTFQLRNRKTLQAK